MDLEPEIDRLYGVPLDEFIAERDALAKRLNSDGEREAGAQVKALRKPTVGAWALNQAIRRRRKETDALLATAERLRDAQDALLSGGDPGELRKAVREERELTSTLADSAEAIASETGKSGPALRDRVRATLHAAALDEEARAELESGRFIREREAVGLGSTTLAPAGKPAARKPAARPPAARKPAARKRERAPAKPARPPKRAPRPAPEAAARDARLAEAEAEVGEARAAHEAAVAEHASALAALESAREALREAEVAERDARRVMREHERELAKRERKLDRMRSKR